MHRSGDEKRSKWQKGRERKMPPGTLAFTLGRRQRAWPVREAVSSSLDLLRKENGGVCSHNTHRKKNLPLQLHPRGHTQVLLLTQSVEGRRAPEGEQGMDLPPTSG